MSRTYPNPAILLSNTKLVLVLFSLLEVSALHCNHPHRLAARPVSIGGTTRAFVSSSTHQSSRNANTQTHSSSRLSAWLSEKFPLPRTDAVGPKKKRRCRCPDDDEDESQAESHVVASSLDESRREAIFAAMGSLWAAASLPAFPSAASATAGVDANMAFPDVMAGLNDRNTKQCLVESLGNRECLVYKETDPDKLLYKGIDSAKLVERIEKATGALARIPPLVETKKWNEVTGILTGPMGELSSTLTLLAGTDAPKTKLARKVKEDLFAMGTATTQRQPDVIMRYHAKAIEDLANFLAAAL